MRFINIRLINKINRFFKNLFYFNKPEDMVQYRVTNYEYIAVKRQLEYKDESGNWRSVMKPAKFKFILEPMRVPTEWEQDLLNFAKHYKTKKSLKCYHFKLLKNKRQDEENMQTEEVRDLKKETKYLNNL